MLVPLNAEYIKVRVTYDFSSERPTFTDVFQVVHQGTILGYCDKNGDEFVLPSPSETFILDITSLPNVPAKFLPMVDDGRPDPNTIAPLVEAAVPDSTPEPTSAPLDN
jgi:hypothetical protein